MIENIRLENFRGFDDHRVPLRATTILVGANNAGKSTVVEALRLIAVATDRLLHGKRRFHRSPDWLDLPARIVGLSPSIKGLAAEGLEPSLFFLYRDPPAIITATFSGGGQVIVYVGPDTQVFVTARTSKGHDVSSPEDAAALGINPVAVQPQVGPLLREEPIRTPETLRRGEGTYLASQHFRNQLWTNKKQYREFRRIAEETWPGLQVTALDGDDMHPKEPLRLTLRDGGFVGEVSLMGHGLQMWLQIIWFLARAPRNATVVLDEPDVYMHPDLQRRLLNLVRTRFAQLIIATHSIEIVSDVEPGSILAVDRHLLEAEFVASLPGLQEVMNKLGAVQNVQMTRLMTAESFLLVEGSDVKLLRILQQSADLAGTPIDLVPHAEIGGRGGWRGGVAERLPTKNSTGDKIRSFAILDRDYNPPEEIQERYAEARRWGIQLRIWSRKELENYLLVPEAISRHIVKRGPDADCSAQQISEEINYIVESMRERIEDGLATVLLARDKAGGLSKANKAAREYVAKCWSDQANRWSLASGKAVISRLSAWSQDSFQIGFGPEQIARSLQPSEVDPEVVEVVSAITEARPFRRPFQMPTTS